MERQLGQQHILDRTAGRGGEHEADEGHILVAGRVVEHVEGTFAVAESDDAGCVDELLRREHANSGDQLIQMGLHARLPDQPRKVLHGVRTRHSLVVAERREPGKGERIGEEPRAAVAAGQQR
ncbi:hypothetical protein [Actinopolymorpha pittospori]